MVCTVKETSMDLQKAKHARFCRDLRETINSMQAKNNGETQLCRSLVNILGAAKAVFARTGETSDSAILLELASAKNTPVLRSLNPHTVGG